VPPGTSSDELVSSLDVLPTFAALARAAPPHDRKIDGLDIGPVLLDDNGRSPRDSYYYYFMRHLNAVRDSRYKLFVQRTEGVGGRRVTRPVSELYDLKADIGETSNVADEHPEIVARLKKLAEKARTDLGDGDQAGADTRPPGFAEKAVTLTSN
jgi:arylsulfatase A-like enzyme